MGLKFLIKIHFILVFIFVIGSANAVDRTQTISLKKGWNAVFLEVDSDERELDEVFADTPVKLVATYYNKVSSAEFIEDPGETEWKTSGWNRWFSPERPDAFLTDLYRLEPGRGYLVFSTADYQWAFTGRVELFKLKWEPNSFTLTGFPVTSIPPSVKQLVDISAVHENQLVYTLDNSGDSAFWRKVTDRVGTPIDANTAYWIYTAGGGEFFSGALEVKLNDSHHVREMDFLDVVDQKRITLRNASSQTRSVQLSLVNNQVPLMVLEKDPVTQEAVYRAVTTDLYSEPLTIEAGEEVEVSIQVDRKQIAPNTEVEGLIKVTDDVGGSGSGGEYWIPVTANGVVE